MSADLRAEKSVGLKAEKLADWRVHLLVDPKEPSTADSWAGLKAGS